MAKIETYVELGITSALTICCECGWGIDLIFDIKYGARVLNEAMCLCDTCGTRFVLSVARYRPETTQFDKRSSIRLACK